MERLVENFGAPSLSRGPCLSAVALPSARAHTHHSVVRPFTPPSFATPFRNPRCYSSPVPSPVSPLPSSSVLEFLSRSPLFTIFFSLFHARARARVHSSLSLSLSITLTSDATSIWLFLPLSLFPSLPPSFSLALTPAGRDLQGGFFPLADTKVAPPASSSLRPVTMRFPFPEEGTDNGIGYGGGGLVNERFIVERDDRRDIPSRIYLKYLSSVGVVNDDDQYGLGVIAQVAIFVLAPLPVRGRAAASSALIPRDPSFPRPVSCAPLQPLSIPRGSPRSPTPEDAHPLSARYLFAILLHCATLSLSLHPSRSESCLSRTPNTVPPVAPLSFPSSLPLLRYFPPHELPPTPDVHTALHTRSLSAPR